MNTIDTSERLTASKGMAASSDRSAHGALRAHSTNIEPFLLGSGAYQDAGSKQTAAQNAIGRSDVFVAVNELLIRVEAL